MLGLWLMGWRIEGNFPRQRKFVVIVAPHTSNWDFVVGILTYFALSLDANWMAKHTALKGPWGPLGRYLGAVPVDRSQAGNVVQSSNAEFAKREKMMLVIAPEGTRSAVEGWKKGYHHIALAAGVPIVPVAIRGTRAVLPEDDLVPRPGRIEVDFGSPILGVGIESWQAAVDLRAKVRGWLLERIGEPDLEP